MTLSGSVEQRRLLIVIWISDVCSLTNAKFNRFDVTFSGDIEEDGLLEFIFVIEICSVPLQQRQHLKRFLGRL